tara:strand:+ start:192 stop:395 length:204 start_codon:yes stop_codon:yes gene_type:complete
MGRRDQDSVSLGDGGVEVFTSFEDGDFPESSVVESRAPEHLYSRASNLLKRLLCKVAAVRFGEFWEC